MDDEGLDSNGTTSFSASSRAPSHIIDVVRVFPPRKLYMPTLMADGGVIDI